MCVKAVDTCPFVFDSVPDQYMTQEVCDKVVCKEASMLKYYPNRHKAQEMCDKAADSCLPKKKIVPDWFTKSKMIEKLDNTVISNDDIVFGDIDSDIVTFFSNDIGLNSVNLNKITLDDDNFDDYEPGTNNHVRFMA